jgi:UDP-N-acetylmuramoyl-L-alanyl-D-glutamate--2,6-diaminopimelate ligase
MTLEKIVRDIEILELEGGSDIEISGISYDSRMARRGHLFFALAGEHVDGHAFIGKAVEGGAASVVYEKTDGYPDELKKPGVTRIRVKDSRAALALASCNFYRKPSVTLPVIGITGTNGKTTTSYLIQAIMREWGHKTGLIGTIQYMIGDKTFDAVHTTPEAPEFQALLSEMLDSGCEYVITEVSSHALAQRRVDGTVFKAAVFTNLTRDHLDYHRTMEEYFVAKKRLFAELLDPGGASVINYDDPWGKRLAGLTDGRVCTYGLEPGADLRATGIVESFRGLEFDLFLNGRKACRIVSSLMGILNVYNILSAAGVLISLGAPWEKIIDGIRKAEPAVGRFERVNAGQDFLAIVDYAHTPDALQRLISAARGISRGKVITVFGCGGDRDRGKRPEMGLVATSLSDIVIITSDNPRSENPEEIISEIEKGAVRKNYFIEPDREEAIRKAVFTSGKDDIVLIAGKGHETYQEISGKKYSFSDREMLEKMIGQLTKKNVSVREGKAD